MAKTSARSKARRQSPWPRRIKRTLLVLVLLISLSFIGICGVFMTKYQEAQAAMETLGDRMAEVQRGPSRILTADGEVLFQISAENRIPMRLAEIPKHVQEAMLAAEDKRFYDHSGVDGLGLVRAFSTIFRDGRVAQGGSTITMQLAKRLYSGNERTLERKIQDIAIAYAMEREVANKNRILELYLNQVYFGEGAHGIGAAAKIYFRKSVKDLTIAEAAMLARCVRLPGRENPIRDLPTARRNRDVVLGSMRELKWITETEYETALNETPKINANPPKTTASFPAGIGKHFVAHVERFLQERTDGIDLRRGGYTVRTTLSSKLQRLAEQTVRRVVRENRGKKVTEGAFVAIDKDGRVLCEVGGIDYSRNQYNIVTQGQLQPGSAFKAIVYSSALMEGVIQSPTDSLSNASISIPDNGKVWTPDNSARWETAPYYSFRTAFAASINRPAIHTSFKVGLEQVARTARSVFGFHSPILAVKSMALGVSPVTPLEMAEAYSVFMLHGDRVRPFPVSQVVDETGAVVATFAPERFVGVMKAEQASIMDEMCLAVVTEGTANRVLNGVVPNARGKTGTTNAAKDAWFCGYTDGIVGIGWVGNQQKVKGEWRMLPMSDSVYGGTVTTYIWRDIMKAARQWYGSAFVPPVAEPKPKDVPKIVKPRAEKVEEAVTTPDPEVTILEPTPTDPPVTDPNAPPTPDPATPTDPNAPPPTEPARSPEVERLLEEAKRQEEARRREKEKPADRPKPRPDPPATAETVSLEICVQSGRVATMYCPETVARSFAKGKAPSRRCRIHGIDD